MFRYGPSTPLRSETGAGGQLGKTPRGRVWTVSSYLWVTALMVGISRSSGAQPWFFPQMGDRPSSLPIGPQAIPGLLTPGRPAGNGLTLWLKRWSSLEWIAPGLALWD